MPWSANQRPTAHFNKILSPVPLPPLAEIRRGGYANINLADLPFLPMENEVLFPNLAYPVGVANIETYNMIKKNVGRNTTGHIIVGTVMDDATVPYTFTDVYSIGVLCEIARVFEVAPDSNEVPALIITVLERVSILELHENNGLYRAKTEINAETLPRSRRNNEFTAMVQTMQELSMELVEKSLDDFPPNLLDPIRESSNPRHIINFSCAVLSLKPRFKQELLALGKIQHRAEKALKYIQEALSMQDLKNQIRNRTQEELDKQQKEYFLTQQIRMIQQELGNEDGSNSDIVEFEEKAKLKKWPEKVAEQFAKDLRKLEHQHPQSPDYSIQFQYLQTLIDLPWGEFTSDVFDLENAEEILNRDHYGLEKIKERILEHLAVLKLRNDMKSPILCLWGPPGVGKTSLGKSIAEALGRKYIRISLGGLHDEAEIRGHRRTYIGAMPGRIIQNIKKAGSANPVVVLDEIDKIDRDYKGDPASALLEVLDPEQNKNFHDNYIDIDFDLSNVFFIATANTLNSISPPLLDRMELIQVTGYIEEEKIEIAKRHLVPKQLQEHGMENNRLTFSNEVLRQLIEGYTRESGVRQFEKQIASVCRKVARQIASDKWSKNKKTLTKKEIDTFLGPPTFSKEFYRDDKYYGVVTGLAWTSVGGEILYIETSVHKGKEGQLILTGNLGNVMKESASIALDYIRSHAKELGLEEDVFANIAIHVHVPEGAIPKDGPSAGITMLISILSAVAKRYMKPRIAMTGEMTLRGKVLPVGGIKEKILAAKRAGITDIILSEENKKDISRINDIYLKGVVFHYVKNIDEVIDLALEPVVPIAGVPSNEELPPVPKKIKSARKSNPAPKKEASKAIPKQTSKTTSKSVSK